MKNTEQITSEQQIENQKAEIQSLNRKIESLERELQRYIISPPDKGKFSYEFKPEPKHGEAALIKQVKELQCQLDDCLEESQNFFHQPDLYSRLFNIVAGVFMDPSDNANKENYDLWFLFREELLMAPDCGVFFGIQSFREVIISMNLFIDDMGRNETSFSLFVSSAENLLSNPNPEGWALAIDALNTLDKKIPPSGSENNLSRFDVQGLRLSLQIIRKCALIAEAADRNRDQKALVKNSLTK